MGIFSRISGFFFLCTIRSIMAWLISIRLLLVKARCLFCVGGAEGRLGDTGDVFGHSHGTERAVGPPTLGETPALGVADLAQRHRVLAAAALQPVLDGQQPRELARSDELELREESPQIDEELVEDLLRRADLIHEDVWGSPCP